MSAVCLPPTDNQGPYEHVTSSHTLAASQRAGLARRGGDAGPRLSSASPGHWWAALHRASGMASTTTGRVLASMRPYTVVAAISRVGGRSYGLALSDPYLSHAAPLSTVRGPGDAVLCASM